MDIKKAAVIGSGVMGSGIAAHIANAGVPVMLLDIVPKGANDRSMLARNAIEKALKTDPAPFMHRDAAKLVTPGNLEDDLGALGECDWIVEAVIEKIEIKHDVFKKLEANRKKGSIVSSNTSTIPLAKLVDGLPDSFQQDFVITHFFNPPRYMRLLEIVAGPRTRKDVVASIEKFCDVRLGKGVIHAKDTPGFVGNRIGTMWIQAAVNAAADHGLTVEEADSVASKPMGFPKTGIFGLLDLVGIDLMPHVGKSMRGNLPAKDPLVTEFREESSRFIEKMIAEGYTGRKGKGGFYRMNKNGGERVKESINLKTGAYAASQKAQLESVSVGGKDLQKLVSHPDKGGKFAWDMLAKTLSYAASLVPEIADDIYAVDQGMKLGYAWKWGPFELIDKLGPKWFAEKLKAGGKPVPALLAKVGEGTFYRVTNGTLEQFTTSGKYVEVKRPEGVLLLADVKRKGKPILKNGSASLWDIGDGVACFEVHTKMNAIDNDVADLLGKSLDHVQKNMKALVLYNEGDNFSVGANIGLALFAANVGVWPMIEGLIEGGQKTYKRMKYAPFPVVAAPSGMALGGGCEMILHSSAVQAHAETYTGLVEVGVGVLPGWGGCKELVTRWMVAKKPANGPMPPIAKVFEMISTAQVAKSAAEARDMMILRPQDGVTMNRDRLLYDAKQKALAMAAAGYKPPEPVELRLPGANGKAALDLAVEGFALQGKALPHDQIVSGEVARVITGGDTDITEVMTEDKMLALERAGFMKLLKTPATLARIEHLLETGKPLRN
jgi:3-hydroxyacyl-CoA dehydrogenase